jgi:hypothetical protein
MELYIRSDLELDSLGAAIREILNVRDANRSPYQREQKRQGANRGGDYYLFQVAGLELTLMRNAAEMTVPGREDFRFYLTQLSHGEENRG